MDQFQVFSTGEPMVMIHRGWRHTSHSSNDNGDSETASRSPKKTTLPLKAQTAHPSRPVPDTVQEFAFVNVTEPGKPRDPETRKLVRGHVVKDSTRKKRLQRQLYAERSEGSGSASESKTQGDEIPFSARAGSSTASSSSKVATMLNPPHPSPLSFLPSPTQGLDPHPQLSPIIYYLTLMGDAMYPLVLSFRFNPISPAAWFDCALKDDALFHALLYTSSTYFGLIRGVTENKEAIVHVGKSIELVKSRLVDMTPDGVMGEVSMEVVEMTLRAISCLAISECLRGNFDGWKIHMIGLKQMADLKGGIKNFSVTLQLKVHRADLMGSSEYLVPPFFADANVLPKLPERDLRQAAGSEDSEILTFLETLPISGQLSNSLTYMHRFSQSVSRILASPTVLNGIQQASLLQHIYSLRYNILRDPANAEFPDEPAKILDEALRLGAMLYISETPKEFPSAAVGPVKLVRRLKELVMQVQMWNAKEAGLVLWLLFIGGIAARKGEDREWYVTQIEKLTGRLNVNMWGGVRGRLEKLWWVGAIHERPCRELWDEVVVKSVQG